jgi:hypothetical protein
MEEITDSFQGQTGVVICPHPVFLLTPGLAN